MTIDRPMFPPAIPRGADQPANLPLAAKQSFANDRLQTSANTDVLKSSSTNEGLRTGAKPARERSPRRATKQRRRRAPALKRRQGVYYPTGVTVEDFFRAYHRAPPLRESGGGPIDDSLPMPPELQSAIAALARLRAEAAAEIERLVNFLDETELPDDLEPAGDELDDDQVDDEDDGTREPWLGAIERHPSNYSATDVYNPRRANGSGHQLAWWDGNLTDLEDEHDGAEPDVDDEPSLGALDDQADQRVAWVGPDMTRILDGEQDPAEAGIADLDGLLEQHDRRGGTYAV